MPIPEQRDQEQARRRLEEWLAGRLPDATDVTLRALPGSTGSGFSSETLLYDASWTEGGERREQGVVVRVEPSAFRLFLETNFEPQFRAIEALGERAGVPVPPALFYEPDPSVLGAPFYVMGRVPGRVPADNPCYHAEGWVKELPAEQTRRLWFNGLETMAGIHAADWRALGLGDLDQQHRGRTGLEQQLAYYREYYEWAASKRRPNATLEAALDWLEKNRPESAPMQLCWGDSRIGNMIFDDDHRCAAVLDWEMVAVGDPAQDVAWYLYLDRILAEETGRLPTLPSARETLDHYESVSGRRITPEELHYYDVFAGMRFGVIMLRLASLFVEFEFMPREMEGGPEDGAIQMLARSLEGPAPR